MKLAIFQEESRYNIYGYDEIRWHCSSCKHISCLPQQQDFSYCMHCGAKIIKKIGGEVRIKKESA